jgi:hypothetical protein
MWQGFFTWRGAVPHFLSSLQPPLGDEIWNALWLCRELIWWYLAFVLSGVIFCFLLDSEIGRWLRAFGRRT